MIFFPGDGNDFLFQGNFFQIRLPCPTLLLVTDLNTLPIILFALSIRPSNRDFVFFWWSFKFRRLIFDVRGSYIFCLECCSHIRTKSLNPLFWNSSLLVLRSPGPTHTRTRTNTHTHTHTLLTRPALPSPFPRWWGIWYWIVYLRLCIWAFLFSSFSAALALSL